MILQTLTSCFEVKFVIFSWCHRQQRQQCVTTCLCRKLLIVISHAMKDGLDSSQSQMMFHPSAELKIPV